MGNDDTLPKTLIELLMEVVAPIAGGITVAIVLQTYTPMATWACFLIALPIGTVLSWLGMIGLIVCVGSVVQAITNRRTKP